MEFRSECRCSQGIYHVTEAREGRTSNEATARYRRYDDSIHLQILL